MNLFFFEHGKIGFLNVKKKKLISLVFNHIDSQKIYFLEKLFWLYSGYILGKWKNEEEVVIYSQ